MAVRIEPHAEPLPGYRLIERLGGGGFGEVWKCEAPGGLHKAIKFVFGNLDLAGDGGQRAEQELKALKRVMTVRHPYVLSLERFDIIDGQLFIVMELADRNLWDRYKECRNQGLPGIPREELLFYMEETAEALDLMNIEYQLQHLDIKPQNIFLVHQHIKVADFGLVKDLEGSQASVTGGITPVYAAPETFDGKVSRFSDQYSFAIVYQEMLTGVRPFAGHNVRQLIMQHLSAEPDVSSLPPADRPAIARALSKEPDQRFPTCRDMVHALRSSLGESRSREVEAPGPLGSRDDEEAQTLREGMGSRTPPITPSPHQTVGPPGDRSAASNQKADRRQPAAERPAVAGAPTPSADPAARGSGARDATATQSIRGPSAQGDGRRPEAPVAPALAESFEVVAEEPEGDGALTPLLVIGVGGLAASVLQALRTALDERFGSAEGVPNVRLLLIDTDPDVLRQATSKSQEPGGRSQESAARSSVLTPEEVLLAPLNRPSHYLRSRDGRASTETWLNQRVLYRIPREQLTTGVRALGRLAFCDNYRVLQRRLLAELDACRDPERLRAVAEQTGLGVRSTQPRIIVVAGLMGGTGSGMFLDVAYAARQLLHRLGYARPDVTGLFFLPHLDARSLRQGSRDSTSPGVGKSKSSDSSASRPADALSPQLIVPLGNACAALAELYHFADPSVAFRARYLEHEPPVEDRNPPFARTLLLSIGGGSGREEHHSSDRQPLGAAEAIGTATRYLLADFCSPLMRWADKGKLGLPAPPAGRRGQYFQTFGLYRLAYPRRQIVRRVAGALLQGLVRHWMSKDSAPLRETVHNWVAEQWRGKELGAEHFIARIQEACEKRLGRAADTVFSALADQLTAPAPKGGLGPACESQKLKAESRQPISGEALAAVLQSYESLLGRPESADDANVGDRAPAGGTLPQLLHEASEGIAALWSQKLAELPVRLIEQPAFRLAGAEEAVRQVVASIERVLQTHEPLARELTDKATAAFVRLMRLLAQLGGGGPAGGRPPAGGGRRSGPSSSEAVLELVRSYPKLRYQALVLQQVLGVYISLRGHLSDTLREINFCRVRLLELSQTLSFESGPSEIKDVSDRRAQIVDWKKNISSDSQSEIENLQSSDSSVSRPGDGYDPEREGPGQYLFPGEWRDLNQAVEGALQSLRGPAADDGGAPAPAGRAAVDPPHSGESGSENVPFALGPSAESQPPVAEADPVQAELDERIQRMIRRQFVALVQVCLASTNVTRNVARAMREVAEAFVEERLGRIDVAGLFLERHPGEQAINELMTLFEEAVPEPARTAQARAVAAQAEVVVLTTPPGPSGEQLRDAAQEALVNVPLVTSAWEGGDDVLLYREWSNLALTDLEHLGPLGQQAYRQMLAADFPPHARQDVPFEIPT